MAVTVTKKTKLGKLIDAPDTTSEVDDLTATADECVALIDLLAEHDAQVEKQRKRLDELKKALVASADETCTAEDGTTIQTSDGREIEISAKSESTSITDLAEARKQLGVATFNQIAKVNITDLRAYLSPPQLAKCTVTERKGSRRLKVTGSKHK